jgi:tRNA 2-thiouridine synthesizing protein A
MNPSDEDEPDGRGRERADALLGDIDRLAGSRCPGCSHALCYHLLLINVAMGLEKAPRCLRCLALALNQQPRDMREHVVAYLKQRACYRLAWDVASDREGVPRSSEPVCLWPTPTATAPARQAEAVPPPPPAEGEATSTWDAGPLACGDLVLALRARVSALRPGAVLRVIARDPAAPEDIPSWCRLTGHGLVRASHPDYFIQRKEH